MKPCPVDCTHPESKHNSLFPLSPSGGPYGAFGGRDASRGLATFNVTSKDDFEYDDLSDLNTMEMDSVREWEMQFKGTQVGHLIRFHLQLTNYSCLTEKYVLCGKLLRPGEQPTSYSDEDDDAPSGPATTAAPGSPSKAEDKKNE